MVSGHGRDHECHGLPHFIRGHCRVQLGISRLSVATRREIPSTKAPIMAISDGNSTERVAVPGAEWQGSCVP